MSDILCLGDSNTFGYLPGSPFDRSQAWPSLYTTYLNTSVQVHVDAACGRPFLDPFFPDSPSQGKARLALHTQKRAYDRIILQLGTNDLLAGDIGADVLGQAMARSMRQVKEIHPDTDWILLLPAFSRPLKTPFWTGRSYEALIGGAHRLADVLHGERLPLQTDLVDTLSFLEGSPDGVHFPLAGHEHLAGYLASH